MPSPRPRPAVERSIHFFRTHLGNDAAGSPLRFNPQLALSHIAGLPFTTSGRYLELDDSHTLCCWPAKDQSRVIFGTIRRRGLPQVERGGKMSTLPIAPTSGLVEAIHVAFFPKNIVGIDFNFYGPRLSRLADYFSEKAPGRADGLTFEPLLRFDVLDQLRKLSDLRVMRLRIRASFADTVRRAQASLADALEAAAEAGQAEVVEVILRMQPHSRRALGGGIRQAVLRLAGQNRLRTEAEHFSVQGLSEISGRVEKIDILRDQYVVNKAIVRIDERSRALDASSAFDAIADAHKTLREELERAATVTEE